jgi:hypothetical protein
MKNQLLLLTVLAILLGFNTVRGGALQCNSNFDSATTFVTDAPMGQGNKQKLLSHIENAWRRYNSGNKNGRRQALISLDTALQLLSSNATKSIPNQLRTQIRDQVLSFRICISDGPAIQTSTLALKTFLPSDLNENGIEGPAPAEGVVYIDGTEIGETGINGEVILQVPAGGHDLEVRLFPSHVGTTSTSFVAGETKQVNMILVEGKDPIGDSKLAIDQTTDGILDRNFVALTMRLVDLGGVVVPLKRVNDIRLLDVEGGPDTYVTDMFTLLTDGTLLLNNVPAFRSLLLSRVGKITLEVNGSNLKSRPEITTADFYISAFKIVGQLVAPPSNPGLNVAGIAVTGTVLNTNLFFNAVTDASGNFEFPLLPRGNFDFTSETIQNGLYYYGQGTFVLNGNKFLTARMLYTTDLVSGVLPFTVEPLPALAGFTEKEKEPNIIPSGREAIFGINKPEAWKVEPPAQSGSLNLLEASVFVSAGTVGVPITQTATINVPQGTKELVLKYNVSTVEYPYYVQAQSIYNDTWGIKVNTGTSGQQIESIGRQINSQLSSPPVWQPNGSTGEIEKHFDIQPLTASGPASFVLFASAMNVGDSALPTSVQAKLSEVPGVTIDSATGDNSVPFNTHSIPKTGESNHFDRSFTLKVTKPTGSTITNVKAKLIYGSQQIVVVDEAPGAGKVSTLDDQTVLVNTIMTPTPSGPLGALPPPTHLFKYEFEITVDNNGTSTTSQRKKTGDRKALWRCLDGFDRFSPVVGARDPGEDDWCSKGAYDWVRANQSKLKAINDISGEHGRHHPSSHFWGTDIDMFHFHRQAVQGLSGTQVYKDLENDVRLAVNWNNPDPVISGPASAAKDRVVHWVTTSRSGIDALAALNEVKDIRYAVGEQVMSGTAVILEVGWAEQLMRTGKTTVGGVELNLGLVTPAWTSAKYHTDSHHDNHVHVALDRGALGEP